MKKKFLALAGLAALGPVGSAYAAPIVYGDFSDLSAFQQNGSTAGIADPVVDEFGRSVLRLTNGLGQSGSAFLTNSINLANQASFSTFFTFRISNPIGIGDGDGQGADGITFVVQTVSNTAGGAGGGIGYLGIPHSVGVEFDTYDNAGAANDPNGNHVGINLGGVFGGSTAIVGTRMNNGADWFAWVDYDGSTNVIDVRLSQSNLRPLLATLSRTSNLVNELGQANAFVGFTSGTGSGGGNHDILNWQFRDTFAPINTNVPEPGTLALLGLGLCGLVLARRKLA